MKIGYGRVSTLDQNLDAQQDALEAARCEQIFVDKLTGRTRERPEFVRAQETLRAGDQLVITKLDRMARSVRDSLNILAELEGRQVDLLILDDNLDTSTPQGRAMFQMRAVFAELELNLIRQRTLEGLAAARKRGRVGGRPKKLTDQKLRDALRYQEESDATWIQVAAEYGIAVSTLHAARKRLTEAEAS